MIDLLTFTLLLVIFYVVYWYLSIPKNLPRGSSGFPLIGSALEYLNAGSQARRLRENVKKYGPLFRIHIMDKLVVVLADYDTIQEALVKQGDVFAGRPQNRFMMRKRFEHKGLIRAEGQVWKEQRRFALSTLRDFGVGRPILEPRIKEEADYLCERMRAYASNGESFDPGRLLTFAPANIICQLIFGKRLSYDDQVLAQHFVALTARVSGAGTSMISPFVLSEAFGHLWKGIPKVRRMAKEQEDFVQFVEGQTRGVVSAYDPNTEPTNYVHAYMKAFSVSPEEAKLDDQLVVAAMDLFVAGSETTTTTLRWALLFLAHNPQVQEKLYEEIKEQMGEALPDYAAKTKLPYVEATIMELQRLSNLVPLGVTRRTLAPTTLRGYHIPEGAIVVPFLGNVLHDPDLFPQPLQFNPDRFLDKQGKFSRDSKVIPFQAGKRICLGEALARMELFIFLTALVGRFRFYFPEDSPSPSLVPVTGFTSTPRPYKVCVEARGG